MPDKDVTKLQLQHDGICAIFALAGLLCAVLAIATLLGTYTMLFLGHEPTLMSVLLPTTLLGASAVCGLWWSLLSRYLAHHDNTGP